MAKGEQQEKVKAEDVQPLINAKQLKALLSDFDDTKEAVDKLTGSHREAIKNAVDKHHLDKEAFALLKKFARIKSVERKADLWTTLLAYMDLSGQMKLIDSVTPLPMDGTAPAMAEEGARTEH